LENWNGAVSSPQTKASNTLPTAVPRIGVSEKTFFCHLPRRLRPPERSDSHRQNGYDLPNVPMVIAKTATISRARRPSLPKRLPPAERSDGHPQDLSLRRSLSTRFPEDLIEKLVPDFRLGG
jgi:hypothetical protein